MCSFFFIYFICIYLYFIYFCILFYIYIFIYLHLVLSNVATSNIILQLLVFLRDIVIWNFQLSLKLMIPELYLVFSTGVKKRGFEHLISAFGKSCLASEFHSSAVQEIKLFVYVNIFFFVAECIFYGSLLL